MGQMDIRDVKPFTIFTFQYYFFFLLIMIDIISYLIWFFHYHVEYLCYSFTYVRLAKLKATLGNGCSKLIDLLCSLQVQIDVYFFIWKFYCFIICRLLLS